MFPDHGEVQPAEYFDETLSEGTGSYHQKDPALEPHVPDVAKFCEH